MTLIIIVALFFLFKFLKPIIFPLLFIGFRVLLIGVVVFGLLAFLFLK
jgi:hypothetical protein